LTKEKNEGKARLEKYSESGFFTQKISVRFVNFIQQKKISFKSFRQIAQIL